MSNETILFSDRLRIAKQAIKVIVDNNTRGDTFGVVCALQVIGALKLPEEQCDKPSTDKPKFWHSRMGALMCDRHIEGLTQKLDGANLQDMLDLHGGKFFVCETLYKSAAKLIAEALGGEFVEHKPEDK